jgi:hypothetical protein
MTSWASIVSIWMDRSSSETAESLSLHYIALAFLGVTALLMAQPATAAGVETTARTRVVMMA